MNPAIDETRRTVQAHAPGGTQPLLSVTGLNISFRQRGLALEAVRDVSFDIGPGEFVGVVGESGSGKSVTALAVMGLLDPRITQVTGSALLAGKDLLTLGASELRRTRGRDVGMVFQEPMTALDPVFTVGHQLTETLHAHGSEPSRCWRRWAFPTRNSGTRRIRISFPAGCGSGR
jgi:peptide/nickel transport system ATP-binding protein